MVKRTKPVEPKRRYTVVVTGGRDFTDRKLIATELELLGPTRLAFGDCPTGVDAITKEWAEWVDSEGLIDDFSWHMYKANWTKFDKAAGPMRNRRMLLRENPELVLAFPGGRGTHNCCMIAKRLGLRIKRVGGRQ